MSNKDFVWTDESAKELMFRCVSISPDPLIGDEQVKIYNMLFDSFKKHHSQQVYTEPRPLKELQGEPQKPVFNEEMLNAQIKKAKLLYALPDILSRIYHYGKFKAETPNERIVEFILTELEYWPTTEDDILKREEHKDVIDMYKKSQQPKPLFTTEDGKPVYEGGVVWIVYDDYSVGYSQYIRGNEMLDLVASHGGKRTFSTEDAAREWVLMNKPCLSLNDLLSVWGNAYRPETSPMFNDFKKLAKTKINP